MKNRKYNVDEQLWNVLVAKYGEHDAVVEYERIHQGIEDGDHEIVEEYESLTAAG